MSSYDYPLYAGPKIEPLKKVPPAHLRTYYVPRVDIIALAIEAARDRNVEPSTTAPFALAIATNDRVTFGLWSAAENDDVVGSCACPGTLAGLATEDAYGGRDGNVKRLAVAWDGLVWGYLIDNKILKEDSVSGPDVGRGRLVLHDD